MFKCRRNTKLLHFISRILHVFTLTLYTIPQILLTLFTVVLASYHFYWNGFDGFCALKDIYFIENLLMEFGLQAEQTCHGSIDKAVGTLLYTIAAKLKAQIVEHRGLLTQYVSQRKIASDLQLTGKIWLLYYYYYHHHHQMNLAWLIFSLAVFRLFWIMGKVFLQTGCSSCNPTDSVKTPNASVSSIFDHCLRLLGTIFYFFH